MSSFMKRKASFEDLLVHQPDHSNLVRPGNVVWCPQQDLPDNLSPLGTGEELLPIFQNIFVIRLKGDARGEEIGVGRNEFLVEGEY